ncbi:hypothetical protein Tco_1017407 [Tanacetum coccineum]|uniref:Uncharacterized protein n=1 Tax=Tanacetum coccineum TaxID=301880 RepID=A0ABQ5FRE1_9ASTR
MLNILLVGFHLSPTEAPPSPDYVTGPKYPPPPDFVPKPVYLEFMPPEDEEDDGDDKDESSDDEDDDDVDIEEDKEEEHPALADSTTIALPGVDYAPSAEETKPFETETSQCATRKFAPTTSVFYPRYC